MDLRKTAWAALAFACATSAYADDGEIRLSAGKWTIENSIVSERTGQSFEDTREVCIGPDRTRVTFKELIQDLMDGGQCSVTTVTFTANTAEATVECDIPEDQTRIRGEVSGSWGPGEYSVSSTAIISGPGGTDKVRSSKTAKHTGRCP